jgi:NleD-like pathogen effector protein (putative zinc metallopeptidase)
VENGSPEAWAHEGRSDVALFHEMVHAYHDTHGTYDTNEVGRPVAGDQAEVKRLRAENKRLQQEEYNAAGIEGGSFTKLDGLNMTENEYRAERRGIEVGAAAGDAEMHTRTKYSF